ncbi:MAG TPA: hypothetical protein VF765_02345 [Polyangiaceae bacterium]
MAAFDLRLGLGVFLAASTAACTFVAPLSGLTGASSSQEQDEGGLEAGGDVDASSDSADHPDAGDAPEDATMDTTMDVGGGGDVLADAASEDGGAPPVDAPPDMPSTTGFCANAGAHFFCADFDEGNVGAGWSTVGAGSNGQLALDTTTSTSPPASARIGGDASTSASLLKYLSPTVPAHVHVDVDVIACPAPSAGVVSLLNVGQDMSGNTGENVLRVQSDGTTDFIIDAYPGDGAEAYNKYVLPSALSTTKFTHVTLDVGLSETNGSVTMSFDGTQVLSVSGIPTSSANVVDSYVVIEARTFQVTAAATAWFDSLTVDVQ